MVWIYDTAGIVLGEATENDNFNQDLSDQLR